MIYCLFCKDGYHKACLVPLTHSTTHPTSQTSSGVIVPEQKDKLMCLGCQGEFQKWLQKTQKQASIKRYFLPVKEIQSRNRNLLFKRKTVPRGAQVKPPKAGSPTK